MKQYKKHSKYKYTYYQNTVNTSTHITKTQQIQVHVLPKHSKYKYTYHQNKVTTSTHITKTPTQLSKHPQAAITTCYLVYTIFGIDILVISLFPKIIFSL